MGWNQTSTPGFRYGIRADLFCVSTFGQSLVSVAVDNRCQSTRFQSLETAGRSILTAAKGLYEVTAAEQPAHCDIVLIVIYSSIL